MLKCHSAGKKSLAQACLDIFGTYGKMDDLNFQGKTDPWILKQSLAQAGITEKDIAKNLDELKKTYTAYLKNNIQQSGATLLPGIKHILQLLKTENTHLLGLLTGNFESSAFIKLAHFELDKFFSFGAFGDDSENRNNLPKIAQSKIKTIYNYNILFHNMIIIGDTPFDIECAKNSGAVSVAVGTGWNKKQELLSHKPDYYFDDLSDADELINILQNPVH